MVEKGENGFKPREFVEFYISTRGMIPIFAGDTSEAKKRQKNREMIEREVQYTMKDLIKFNSMKEERGMEYVGDVIRKKRKDGSHSFKIR